MSNFEVPVEFVDTVNHSGITYDEEAVANVLYEMDKQQLRYLLSVIEGILTSK